MVKTILPAHKSAAQKALDTLTGERFEGLDINVISIIPKDCPKEILPHLAESFDVDISGLNEQQTRELLQDAFKIHYYAGTPYSIKRALQIVFAHAGIEEWMQYEGNPYYFRITVNSTPNITGITANLLEKLVRTANRYKNARSLIDVLRLNAGHAGNINIGIISDATINSAIYPGESSDVATNGDFYIGGAAFSAQEITIMENKL
ncbi:MAG: phage tail protein I [Campylobacteraceae bacterium]|jgi:phage tail P2-like protein|nr:phage tail protein I [Campylobacteraceae bacterium]